MAGRSTGHRYDAEFMSKLLARARERGISLVRLSRESGISLPTLCRWRRRLEGRTSRFVELVPTGGATACPESARARAAAAASIEVVTRFGDRVRVDDGASELLLERVFAALLKAC